MTVIPPPDLDLVAFRLEGGHVPPDTYEWWILRVTEYITVLAPDWEPTPGYAIDYWVVNGQPDVGFVPDASPARIVVDARDGTFLYRTFPCTTFMRSECDTNSTTAPADYWKWPAFWGIPLLWNQTFGNNREIILPTPSGLESSGVRPFIRSDGRIQGDGEPPALSLRMASTINVQVRRPPVGLYSGQMVIPEGDAWPLSFRVDASVEGQSEKPLIGLRLWKSTLGTHSSPRALETGGPGLVSRLNWTHGLAPGFVKVFDEREFSVNQAWTMLEEDQRFQEWAAGQATYHAHEASISLNSSTSTLFVGSEDAIVTKTSKAVFELQGSDDGVAKGEVVHEVEYGPSGVVINRSTKVEAFETFPPPESIQKSARNLKVADFAQIVEFVCKDLSPCPAVRRAAFQPLLPPDLLAPILDSWNDTLYAVYWDPQLLGGESQQRFLFYLFVKATTGQILEVFVPATVGRAFVGSWESS